ncbi:MAG: DUF4258 domain-containing protein [Alphaproteobacteria bacterium]|nr:MAG: DUF4258 domain-containing protein [Alphaproteobacteria bacterium]TMJ49376.1 MAG: DUF4258 domain-containing protein [Alphaproteobacteria bacterium]
MHEAGPIPILFTRHAIRRLSERNIRTEWVERAIRDPDREIPDPTDPGLTRAYKRVPEANGRVLRVVYSAMAQGGVSVITAFFDHAAH